MRKGTKTLDDLTHRLRQGLRNRKAPGPIFRLKGAPRHKRLQKEFLRRHDFSIAYERLHSGLATEEEYLAAVTLIWQHKIKGWWRYKNDLLAHNICTPEQYQNAHRDYFGGGFFHWLKNLFRFNDPD